MADLTLFEGELLTVLVEEAAEVIKEGCKAVRFGVDTEWQGSTPRIRLSREIGEMFMVVEEMLEIGLVDREEFLAGHAGKSDKLRTFMAHHPKEPGDGA